MAIKPYSKTAREYALSDAAVDRYKTHGIARVIVDTGFITDAGGFIDTSRLALQPRAAWLKRKPIEPCVIIASAKVKKIPNCATRFDDDKKLEGIEVCAFDNRLPNRELLRGRYNANGE